MPDQETAAPGKSSKGKELLLVVVAVAATLVLGEVAARFILPAPFKISSRKISSGKGMPRFSIDREIGWINEPSDETYHFVSPGRYGTTDAVYHLHQGLRDTPAAPASDPILLTTGCSFTFGFGVNDADSWPWILGEQLPGYRVVNVGTSAYGVNQSLMRAERYEAENPGKVKMILYGFTDFHVDRDRAHQRDLLSLYPTGRPRILMDGERTRNNGLVYFWGPGTLMEHSDLFMHVVNHVAEIGNKTPSSNDSNEISVRLLQEFAERCRAKNILFGVIILPHGSDHGPLSTKVRTFVVPRLQKAGVRVFAPDFPRDANGNIDRRRYLIASDEFHPNRDYNVNLAGSVAKFVQAELIPAAATAQSPAK